MLWRLSKKRESARMGANGADGANGPDGADGTIGTNATDRRRRRITTLKDRTNTPTVAIMTQPGVLGVCLWSKEREQHESGASLLPQVTACL